MERFSSATLAAVLDEVCLQGHLLSRGFLLSVAERSSGPDAVAIGAKQATGVAGLTTKRLAPVVAAGPDLDGVARVLEVHPLFHPRSYVALSVDRSADGTALTVSLGPCPALEEDDGLTWPSILADGHDGPLVAAVTCLAPQAQVRRVDPVGDAVASWEVTVDPDAPPAAQPDEVTLTEFSTGATFHFTRRG